MGNPPDAGFVDQRDATAFEQIVRRVLENADLAGPDLEGGLTLAAQALMRVTSVPMDRYSMLPSDQRSADALLDEFELRSGPPLQWDLLDGPEPNQPAGMRFWARGNVSPSARTRLDTELLRVVEILDRLRVEPNAPNLTTDLRGSIRSMMETMVAEADRLEPLYVGIVNGHIRQTLKAEVRQWRTEAHRALETLDALADLKAAVERTHAAAVQAEAAADAASNSAGIVGTANLAKYFEDFARSSSHEAYVWFAIAGATVVGTIIAAIFHLGTIRDLSWLELARKATVGLPGTAVLLIAVRESNRLRDAALWARHLSVQLKSVRAYTEDLTDETRSQLRAALGHAAFAGPPRRDTFAEPAPTNSDLVVLLRTTLEALSKR